MSHLASFRQGWQNEILAKYILYKFSFVAQPSTIADDVGSDYFCTLFDVVKEKGHNYLVPRNSFAIQIKSETDAFDASNKIQYLEDLEIPFFIGVANRKDLTLSFYSGEYVPALFSFKGTPKILKLEPYEKTLNQLDDYLADLGNNGYRLRFPKVTKISATMNGSELRSGVEKIHRKCSLIYKSIASKSNGEYLFKFGGTDNSPNIVLAFAGPGSAKQFRGNLIDRLAEAFLNLKWIYEKHRTRFTEEEFRAYEKLLLQLKGLKSSFGPIPNYVENCYLELKNILDANNITAQHNSKRLGHKPLEN